MLGYGPEDKNAVLELTYNYGVTEYEKGNAYAQVENLIAPLISEAFLSNVFNIGSAQSAYVIPSIMLLASIQVLLCVALPMFRSLF